MFTDQHTSPSLKVLYQGSRDPQEAYWTLNYLLLSMNEECVNFGDMEVDKMKFLDLSKERMFESDWGHTRHILWTKMYLSLWPNQSLHWCGFGNHVVVDKNLKSDALTKKHYKWNHFQEGCDFMGPLIHSRKLIV